MPALYNLRKSFGVHAGADISENFFDIPANMTKNSIQNFALFPCKTIFSDESAQRFIEQSRKCNILPHAFHDNNLASPSASMRECSVTRIVSQSRICLRLNIFYLNVHAGSSLKQVTAEEAVKFLAYSISKILSQVDITIVVENSCGSGGKIMSDLNDYNLLFSILSYEEAKRVEICIDTCHIFAAGYDIRDFNVFLSSLSSLPKRPFAFHLNDSKEVYNSKLDRHEKIGLGEIGWQFFDNFFQSEYASTLTVTETPGTTYERINELNDIISRYEQPNH